MVGFVRNWRVELVEAYPDLFQSPAGHPEGAQGTPECDAGWRDVIERCCVRIRTALSAGDRFYFEQIKWSKLRAGGHSFGAILMYAI